MGLSVVGNGNLGRKAKLSLQVCITFHYLILYIIHTVHFNVLVVNPQTYDEQVLLVMQIGDPLSESEIELLRVDFPIPNLDTRYLAFQGLARILRPPGAVYHNPPPALQLDVKTPVHGDLTALGPWTTKPHIDWSQLDLGSTTFASRRELITWLRGSVDKKMTGPPTKHGNNCVDFLQEVLETLPLDSRKNVVDKFKEIVDEPGKSGLSRRAREDKIWQRMEKYGGWTDGKNH